MPSDSNHLQRSPSAHRSEGRGPVAQAIYTAGDPFLESVGSVTAALVKAEMLDSNWNSLATQNAKWYIIRATPQADFLAAAELLDAGFEIFSPRIKSHQSKNSPHFTPLFPGYFFLKWDLEGEGKPSFHGSPHVSGWVNFEGVAPAVPDEVISELAYRVEHINRDGGLWRRFEMGDKVRIVAGTLEGSGEVVEAPSSAHSRVRILMQFMGRLVPVQVPWNSLEPLEQRPMEHVKPPRRTRGQGRWIRNIQPPFSGSN